MSETERYVAYYLMPAVGETSGAASLIRQRQATAAFLDHPDRELVAEFTEVMAPAREGETSPAFDLALECCMNLDAKLICAVPQAQLASTAQAKAAGARIGIHLIADADPLAVSGRGDPAGGEIVPHLNLGRGRRGAAFLPPRRLGEVVPAGSRAKADRFAMTVLPIIDQIRKSGAATLTDIAEGLNARNIPTARGRRWYPTTVKNILDRRL